MRSCFILGCGRSGTSLTAGLLARAGYFMGAELYPPDEGNPKGYFEAREINAINEGMLARILPGARRSFAERLMGRPARVTGWYRWLAEVDSGEKVLASERLAARISAQVAHRPFCFKDPRFCYTLAAWREFAPDAAVICVFRAPGAAASSIVKEAARSGITLNGRVVDFPRALAIWRAAYRYVLEVHRPAGGDWLFVAYEQLVEGGAYGLIEQLLEVTVDRGFADTQLRRSPEKDVSPADQELYRRMCELAGFDRSECASQL